MGEALLIEKDTRGVATLTLNRPQVHNAFDAALIADITQAFSALGANDSVRLVVLKGNGKSFCAGGDLNWMRAMKDFSPEENRADAGKLAQMFITIRQFEKPLIGVVHGVAFGGGSGLAALCDFVLAADDAKFGFTETKLGLLPATICPFVMEKIGAGHARARFISGAPFSAQEALTMGLVHKLVAASELEKAAGEVVAQFLAAAPGASVAAKQMIDAVWRLMEESGDAASAQVTSHTVAAIAQVRAGAEAQEGMGALLDGRKPKWSAS